MPASTDMATLPLRAVLRPAPTLAPEDSLHRFLSNARFLAASTLPVLEGGQLRGMVQMADVLPILALPLPEERTRALNQPLADVLRPAVAIARRR